MAGRRGGGARAGSKTVAAAVAALAARHRVQGDWEGSWAHLASRDEHSGFLHEVWDAYHLCLSERESSLYPGHLHGLARSHC